VPTLRTTHLCRPRRALRGGAGKPNRRQDVVDRFALPCGVTARGGAAQRRGRALGTALAWERAVPTVTGWRKDGKSTAPQDDPRCAHGGNIDFSSAGQACTQYRFASSHTPLAHWASLSQHSPKPPPAAGPRHSADSGLVSANLVRRTEPHPSPSTLQPGAQYHYSETACTGTGSHNIRDVPEQVEGLRLRVWQGGEPLVPSQQTPSCSRSFRGSITRQQAAHPSHVTRTHEPRAMPRLPSPYHKAPRSQPHALSPTLSAPRSQPHALSPRTRQYRGKLATPSALCCPQAVRPPTAGPQTTW
jgi:hypothetical protein